MEQAAADFTIKATWEDHQELPAERWCSGGFDLYGGIVVCDHRGRPLYTRPFPTTEPRYVTLEFGD